MTATRVEFVIDELVLHGFAPGDRHAIGEALTIELQRLAAAGDSQALAHLGNLPVLRSANVTLQAGAGPRTVGAQVAQAVHGSLNAGRGRKGR